MAYMYSIDGHKRSSKTYYENESHALNALRNLVFKEDGNLDYLDYYDTMFYEDGVQDNVYIYKNTEWHIVVE